MSWEADQIGYDYEKAGYIIDENTSAGNISGAFIAHKYNFGIAISLEHGNTRSRVLSSLSDAKAICDKARYQYLNHFRTNFPVSAKAMTIELLCHAMPDVIVDLFNNPIVDFIAPKAFEDWVDGIKASTKAADMNLSDAQRNFDDFMETVYDFIATPKGMTLVFG